MDQYPTPATVFKPVERGAPPDGGVLAAGFCATVALLWMVTCVLLLLQVLANQPTLASTAACLLGIALGAGALASQAPQLALALWFRRPRGAISTGPPHTEGRFTFRYSQRVIKPATAELTCSLLLREVVPQVTPDGIQAPATWIDHLVASCRNSSTAHYPGDLLMTGCEFSIPDELETRFGLGGGCLQWRVRVRVRLPDQRDFWEEFRLPFEPDRPRRQSIPASPTAVRRFSVVVLRLPDWFWPERTPEALLEVSPHLHRVTHLPVRALETLSRDEAERACRRLEASGAAIALYCDNQLVERAGLHNLPIPQAEATLPSEVLPIPTTTEPGVAEVRQPAIQPFFREAEPDPRRLRRAS